MKTAPDLQPHLESPPEAIYDLVREGKAALEQGDLDSALAKFEQVVIRFPERPEGHNNLGALYTSLGRLEKAEESFGRVLEVLPDNGNVHYNRGIVRIRLKKFSEAISDFQRVLAVAEEDADSWNNLGVATFMGGDPAGSRPHFEKALKLVPDFPNALLNLCDAEVAAGRRFRGISLCQDFTSRFRNPEVQQKQLDLLTDEARELLEQGCRIAESLQLEEPANESLRQRRDRIEQARQALPATVVQP